MADNVINVRLQSAYKTATEWTTANPVLGLGEVGYEIDSGGLFKIGNGTSTWNQLPYSNHRPLTNNDFDTANITDANVGNLIVTGAARFTNVIQGTASSASNADTIDGYHASAFLKLSGGTMTGILTAKGSVYKDAYTGALNMNNSNIYGLNSIYTADASDAGSEGIHFYRDATHVDTLWMNGGDLLFVPNRLLSNGSSSTATKATSEKVARLPASITTGQVMLTDTTGGLCKTVATSTWASSATFTGAGASTNGVKGIVPAPTSGQQTYYLRGDGSWASTAHTHNYLPATSTDTSLKIESNILKHKTTITATANISGSAAASPAFGGTFAVPYFSIDGFGHSTAVGAKTITIPSAVYTTASATTNGAIGLVPAPTSGQQDFILSAGKKWVSSAHTHNYLPATSVDASLKIESNTLKHATTLTASANISGTANVSGWGQTATVAVPSIDAYGHTTACKTKTITMPSSTGLATEAYVNERVANAVHFKGGFNANNADALKTPLKEVGDMYLVSTAGTFYGLELEVGDSIIFQSTVAAGINPTSADFIGVEKTVSVENKGPTLSWGNTSTVGVVEGVNLTVKMPADPNTDTKVTAVGNHYTPSSSGTFSPIAGGTTTDISTTTLNIITGLQKDAAGHITGVVSGSIKATNTPNTDEKLKMTPASATKFYPAGGTSQTSAVSTAYFSSAVYIQGTSVVAANFVGTATTASYAANAAQLGGKASSAFVLKAGDTMSGNLAVTNVLGISQNAGTAGGISLYSGTGYVTSYGIAFRVTSNGGKHGYVQGDWATYGYMDGPTNRGWILKHPSSGPIFSVDGTGNVVANGTLTVGGSSANNTGVQLSFNKNTSSLDFIFV